MIRVTFLLSALGLLIFRAFVGKYKNEKKLDDINSRYHSYPAVCCKTNIFLYYWLGLTTSHLLTRVVYKLLLGLKVRKTYKSY